MALWTPGAVRIATDELREYVSGKRIALMMNSTALDSEGRTLIDRIAEEKWAEIAFLFGMEHGVRGNLYGGDGKLGACDARTGLPIVNLYQYPGCRPPADRLREVDAESADAIHENNVHRVIRALEIFETTGVPKSEWDKRSKEKASDYEFCVVGLRYGSRELLYDRINRRVDAMMESGLLKETKSLMEEGVFARNSTAAQAIGYKELLAHLDGKESLLEAVERLKTATRRYAKRQITWFSAKPYVRWVDADAERRMRAEEEILSDILARIEDAKKH